MGLSKKKLPWLVKLHFVFWLIYFAIFWGRALEFDAAGNLFANHVNIWGDWAAHFTIGSKLAFNQLTTQESPFLINQQLSYPYAADLISAALIKLGVPFFTSFIVPSFFFSVLTVAGLYYFYRILLHSKKLAVLASNLFLFNGGLGFIYFFQDMVTAERPWSVIFSPPRKYTNIEPLFYRFISVVNSMIIPQRSFVLGFPLALLALALIYQVFFQKNEQEETKKETGTSLRLIKVGLTVLILGLMPWLHTHSFLACFIILFFWMSSDLINGHWSHLKDWLLLAIGVALLSWPIISNLFVANLQNNFFIWQPGWYCHSYPEVNWWLFWLKNWGLVPLLALGGYGLILAQSQDTQDATAHTVSSEKWGLYLPFFVIFLLLNLFLFQPFIWDNTKLLIWAAVGFYALAAKFLVYSWRKTQHGWQKMILVLIFSSCILAGLLDNYRALRFKLHHYQLYSAEELALVEWVKKNTAPNTVWLTGSQHNNWLYNLTGRQALMVFPGWLWTHGYDYRPVQRDQTLMLQNPHEHLALFDLYQVDYVTLGPNEKTEWQAQVYKFANSNNFKLVKSSAHYQIYAYEPD